MKHHRDTHLISFLYEVIEADEVSHRCALDTDLVRVLNEVTEADEAWHTSVF